MTLDQIAFEPITVKEIKFEQITHDEEWSERNKLWIFHLILFPTFPTLTEKKRVLALLCVHSTYLGKISRFRIFGRNLKKASCTTFNIL
jgi:hypothetical protein